MVEAYLTIDDSPTPHSKELGLFLKKLNIPALFFCRGDMLAKYGQGAVDLIEMGFLLGNHANTHTRFSEMDYGTCIAEIEHTQAHIEKLYKRVNKTQNVKSFRFPHMDRGTGGWIIDYNKINEEYRDFVISLFADGLNITLDEPSAKDIEKKDKLQDYLKSEGYVQPFQNVTLPWFQGTEMETATDSMYTFSTSDWMLLNRHKGKWPYNTLDSLKSKIDDDEYFLKSSNRHIVLAHDKPDDEIFPVVKSLVEHMLERDVVFVDFEA